MEGEKHVVRRVENGVSGHNSTKCVPTTVLANQENKGGQSAENALGILTELSFLVTGQQVEHDDDHNFEKLSFIILDMSF